MYNELRKMCLACDAIMCGERNDAYMFMCAFLLANTPGRPGSSVLVVSGDGFFSQSMVIELGFICACYLHDWFDLFDIGLSDRFGANYELIQTELSQMINATTAG